MSHPTEMIQLNPRSTNAAGLQVRRVLPHALQRAVGPFVFFDHFGPVTLPPGVDTDVGPHPHIGLATVTYVFEGGFLHRDSLGTVQLISPGAINWMTAGNGIVHSERTPPDERGSERRMHGLQLWVALPASQEAGEPAFQHVAADAIPQSDVNGVQVRVLVGSAYGLQSPVRSASPTLYLALHLPPGASLTLPDGLAQELAVYSTDEAITVDGQVLPPQIMGVLPASSSAVSGAVSGAGGAATTLLAPTGARVVLVGGDKLDGPRHLWWNFVATTNEALAEAAARWDSGGFTDIPGEDGRLTMPPYPVGRAHG